MLDTKTIERINLLHPKLRSEVSQIYQDISEQLDGRSVCRFTSTLRTFAEQRELYSLGRTKKGRIVTNAREGFSYHNYGLAIDIVLLDGKTAIYDTKKDIDGDGKSDWIEVVTIFKQYGWEWGGDWKFYDAPHFQKSYGYSIRSLYNMYILGKVDEHNYVKI
jgi:peptidoglycan L-alanyl-D-glutamate endopeptidase CwlK